MIALLTGILIHKSPEFIILDVNGVGYRVQIPFSTYYELPATGATISLDIYTHVKEDAIHLFGFRSRVEKLLFQLLIGVSGIGPKLAKDILSNIEAADFTSAVMHGNVSRLSTIPGIGKKTSERLVLELRDKMVKMDLAEPTGHQMEPTASSEVVDDVASALINLGYKESIVKKALAEMEIPAGSSMETVLKQALKRLMK